MTNILIIDDEKTSRMAIDSIFTAYGSCEAYSTGELGIEAYKSLLDEGDKFDLIVLDISLENESGVDVLTKIRELEKKEEITGENQAVIIMATGNNDVKVVRACIDGGCNDYVIKPLKTKIIASKMEKFNFKAI